MLRPFCPLGLDTERSLQDNFTRNLVRKWKLKVAGSFPRLVKFLGLQIIRLFNLSCLSRVVIRQLNSMGLTPLIRTNLASHLIPSFNEKTKYMNVAAIMHGSHPNCVVFTFPCRT